MSLSGVVHPKVRTIVVFTIVLQQSVLSQMLPLTERSLPPLPEVMMETLSPHLTTFCINQMAARKVDWFCWEAMSVIEREMYSATHQAGDFKRKIVDVNL